MLHARPRYIDLTPHALEQRFQTEESRSTRKNNRPVPPAQLGLRVHFHAVAVRHAVGGGGEAAVRLLYGAPKSHFL